MAKKQTSGCVRCSRLCKIDGDWKITHQHQSVPIYYPGFTLGGISEPVGIILTVILLFLTSVGSTDFGLTLMALWGPAFSLSAQTSLKKAKFVRRNGPSCAIIGNTRTL